MGKNSKINEHIENLEWAKKYQHKLVHYEDKISRNVIKSKFNIDLINYFKLCALSRSRSVPRKLAEEAEKNIFNLRVKIEKSIFISIKNHFNKKINLSNYKNYKFLFDNFYSFSKKQGVSLRMPLFTCVPTKICSKQCYAHDALDSTPRAVIKGVINAYLAYVYENNLLTEKLFLECINKSLLQMINLAIKDSEKYKPLFQRRPRVRFSHVGEFTEYFKFANFISRNIQKYSKNKVDCIIYTRHPDAKKLNTTSFKILFTIDDESYSRIKYKPKKALLVKSAFSGNIDNNVDINFLEHHRWFHALPKGQGKICPTTLPDTSKRTCDSCKCNICFV